MRTILQPQVKNVVSGLLWRNRFYDHRYNAQSILRVEGTKTYSPDVINVTPIKDCGRDAMDSFFKSTIVIPYAAKS